MENSLVVPQKIKLELPYNSAIPLPGIYPKELKTGPQIRITHRFFTAVLFTIAKKQKHPKCPLTHGWMTVTCIHTNQPQKGMKYSHTLQCRYTLEILCQMKEIRHIQYDSINRQCPKHMNPDRQSIHTGAAGRGWRETAPQMWDFHLDFHLS